MSEKSAEQLEVEIEDICAQHAWMRQALLRKAASLENAERSVEIQHVRPIGRWMRQLVNGIDEDAKC